MRFVQLMYGSGMSNGNSHASKNLPIITVGGGASVVGGRHIVAPLDTPLTNLQLSILDWAGIHLEAFGDSTGRLSIS